MARMWASVNVPSQRRAAVSAGAEADQLVGVAHVGPTLEILAFEPGQVNQHLFRGRLARKGGDRHRALPIKLWWKKGDGHLLPERPEGCFAQKVPVPFFAHGNSARFPPNTRSTSRSIVTSSARGDDENAAA